jgi:hypothetical protein
MKLVAVTPTLFASKRWSAPKSYAIAANDALATLVIQEIPKAVMTMPVAFVPQGNEFNLAAVQGLQQGKNLFVGADGLWKHGYIPACYRAFPFSVASTENGEQVLCFDQDSQLLTDNDGQGFYEADGTLTEAVKKIADFLAQVLQNRVPTRQICDLLQQHNLIQPWPITLKTDRGEQAVNGFFRIDESALRQLSADALQQLNEAGALGIAYFQLLSTHNMQKLVDMATADALSAQVKKPSVADLISHDSGTIDLSFL